MSRNFLGLDIMSIVLLVLLYLNANQTQKNKRSGKVLNRVILWTTASLVSEIVYYCVDGTSFLGARGINYLFTYVYFIATVVTAYEWKSYTSIELYAQPNEKGYKKRILSVLPAVLLIVMVLLSPATHWIFYINRQNIYTRGSLNAIQVLISYGYIVAAAAISCRQYKKEVLPERKKRCLNLCFYTILPVIGGLVQGLFFGFNIAVPSIVVAVIMVYLDNIRQDISLDPLTKLNNRGQFDNHLLEKIRTSEKGVFFLIFFDIDGFKMINDEFGHLEGDKAIVIVSKLIKAVFSDSKAFLSRYGGDEFAVIINGSEAYVINYLSKIRQQAVEISTQLPFVLSISAGYAQYKPGMPADALIQAADENMYYNKERKYSRLRSLL